MCSSVPLAHRKQPLVVNKTPKLTSLVEIVPSTEHQRKLIRSCAVPFAVVKAVAQVMRHKVRCLQQCKNVMNRLTLKAAKNPSCVFWRTPIKFRKYRATQAGD